MKMKKTKLILTAFALIALSTQSCKDFLDEKLVSNVSANSYYKTPKGLEDAADATYFFLREIYSKERAYTLTVFGTDTIQMEPMAVAKHLIATIMKLNSGADILREPWTFLYQGINQANAIVARAPPDKMAEETLKPENR